MNILYWIKNLSRKFKSFVANRIGEIHIAAEPTQWNFVNGRINPAAIGNQGIDIVALSGCSTWWNGPEFLLGNKTDWPQQKFELAEKSNLEFKNTAKTCLVSVMHQTVPHQKWRLHFNRFSNWRRLLRVIGWVKQFIQNSRSVKEQQDVGQLSPSEMADAEVYTIKLSQKECFKQEYEPLQRGGSVPTSSKLASLLPELDSDGLMRYNGQLKYAEFLPYFYQGFQ